MICKLNSRPVDLTRKRLFFFLLKQARRSKYALLMNWPARRAYLMGIYSTFVLLYDDFRLADDMRLLLKSKIIGKFK